MLSKLETKILIVSFLSDKLRKALNKGLIPESQHTRIKDNEKWYNKSHVDEMNKRAKLQKQQSTRPASVWN